MLNTIPGDISRAQLGWREQVRLREVLKIFAKPAWRWLERAREGLHPSKINVGTVYNKPYCRFNDFSLSDDAFIAPAVLHALDLVTLSVSAKAAVR